MRTRNLIRLSVDCIEENEEALADEWSGRLPDRRAYDEIWRTTRQQTNGDRLRIDIGCINVVLTVGPPVTTMIGLRSMITVPNATLLSCM